MFEMENFYSYPKIYIEYQKYYNNDEIIVEKKDNVFCKTLGKNLVLLKNYRRTFIKKVYETAYIELLDLEKGLAKKSFITYSPMYNTYYLVERKTKLQLMDIAGLKVYLHVNEGDKIEEGTILGKQITGKFEVRNIISNISGIVVYIGTVFEEKQHYIIASVGEVNVRKINITEC